nr:hypothetical protein [Tanacetum cinerariifolium]
MTNGESVKDMTSKFDKLEEDEMRKRRYICRGHILNGMSDSLFDIYQNTESAKALWESLESKYMAEDASATKDGAKNFNNNNNKRKFKSSDDKFANKMGTITCWKCKKTGHMKKDCRSRKGNDDAGSNGSKDPEKQQG